MSLVEKQHTNDSYYIVMEHKNNCIVVQVCPRFKEENYCGYPIKEMTYTINEKEKQTTLLKDM